MEIIPPYLLIYQQILKDLENALPFLKVPKAKAGRKPKLTDIHIAAIFILSYITNTKVLTLAQLLIDPSIHHTILHKLPKPYTPFLPFSECPNLMHTSKAYPHIINSPLSIT